MISRDCLKLILTIAKYVATALLGYLAGDYGF